VGPARPSLSGPGGQHRLVSNAAAETTGRREGPEQNRHPKRSQAGPASRHRGPSRPISKPLHHRIRRNADAAQPSPAPGLRLAVPLRHDPKRDTRNPVSPPASLNIHTSRRLTLDRERLTSLGVMPVTLRRPLLFALPVRCTAPERTLGQDPEVRPCATGSRDPVRACHPPAVRPTPHPGRRRPGG
jgi:hypothetical protein